MSPRIVVTALIVLWATAAAAQAPTGRTVDLNAPGILAALEQSNPDHYDKISRILAGIVQTRDPDVPRWMRTAFGARDVTYAPIVLTSDPPRRRLSFSLNDVRYQAMVTLTGSRGEIVPLR